MRIRLLPFLLATVASISTPARAAPGDVDSLDIDSDSLFGLLALPVQPDGKMIIGGHFITMLGVPRHYIARLNADGTMDMGFDPSPNADVSCVAIQEDGKVLLGGGFTRLYPNGGLSSARRGIARVHPDGTLDTGFDPKPNNNVHCLAVQADGKVLLGGTFTTLQPNGAVTATARNRIARLNADGTLDAGFNPNPNDYVESIAIQADGKVLIGGTFNTLQPNGAATATPRRYIARVNADGTLDTGFDPKASGSSVYSVVAQADGKVLIGGNFSALQPNGASAPTSRDNIARLNADGTLDTGFDPKVNNDVTSIALQSDGKVLMAGNFNTLQPNGALAPTARLNIARVHADGTLDAGFAAPRPNYELDSLAMQADGRVLVGGNFTYFTPNGPGAYIWRRRFARLENDTTTQSLAVPDTTQILWERGGAAPEANRVTFDLSTNGGASWTSLGPGTRIGTTSNWQITGLNLGGSGQIRARGVASGGYQNGSSSLFGQEVSFFFADGDNDGLLDSWEITHFSTTTGHSAGDDFDHDGYNELLELALGLNPTVPNPGGLPLVTNEGGYPTMTIPKHAGASYEVQSAGTVLPALPDSFSAANTTVLVNDGTTLKVRDNFLITAGSRRFLRVKVTADP